MNILADEEANTLLKLLNCMYKSGQVGSNQKHKFT